MLTKENISSKYIQEPLLINKQHLLHNVNLPKDDKTLLDTKYHKKINSDGKVSS